MAFKAEREWREIEDTERAAKSIADRIRATWTGLSEIQTASEAQEWGQAIYARQGFFTTNAGEKVYGIPSYEVKAIAERAWRLTQN